MKNASETMFKIGKIINIILIPVAALLLIVGVVFSVVSALAAEAGTASQEDIILVASASGTLIGYGVVLLVTSILSLVICTKKKAEIDGGSNEVAPRVFIIVFGAIAENVFYVLAGIFSLVARSQEMNNTNNTTQE